MVPDSGQIFYPAASNQNDGMFLKIVPDAWNIGGNFYSGCQSDPRDFPQGGIGFFGR
jgi:hypothetical protein